MSALLTMPKLLNVWITINWEILKEMGIPDHLICLLRNLYAGQEATVRNSASVYNPALVNNYDNPNESIISLGDGFGKY